MKKLVISLAAMTLLFSCSEDNNLGEDALVNNNGVDLKQERKCYASENFDQMMLNPLYAENVANIEQQASFFAADQLEKARKKPRGGGDTGGDTGGGDTGSDGLGVVNIPVVVHVLYSNNSENISDAQIASQIAVLNADFRKQNADASSVPSQFAGLVADSEISFTLASVNRKASSRTSWGTNDAMKSSANGGADAVDPANNLNIWVCNIGGGILGYAQFPGGPASTDGVVVSPQYFGTTGTAAAPFDGGRTATHEVGHYLNLRHIWGDGRCNRDDFVSDTPKSDRANYGCPSYPTTNCRSADMTMNYMDYTNDACMSMFSNGQKLRMRSLFAAGGARASLAN